MNGQTTLDDRLSALNKPRSGGCYYAITLTAAHNNKVVFGTQTYWVGWADAQQRHELRKARLVYPEFVKLWKGLKQPYAFIHTVDELILFLLGGGNALVEQELGERFFPRMLDTDVSIPHGPRGFIEPGLLEPTAFRRAPTPKIRMQVFDRDNRRCRICGRRPDDNTDLVLHVHRIRPWEKGGVTDPSNLITLCHTCHSGLVTHEDHTLFSLVEPEPKDALESLLLEFKRGVVNYRRVGFFANSDPPPRTRLPRQRNATHSK
jgi:hypothetical protein